MNDQLNREEREILEKFDRGELRPITDVEREMTTARQAARSTFKKTRRIDRGRALTDSWWATLSGRADEQ